MVVFSQWLRMHEILGGHIAKEGWGHAFFHGSVESRERGKILDRFRDDPECRVFLSTDAGGVGLNLQHASVVLNVDLPWNPAVLEQRIGRVHRIGQREPVRVINFVAEKTIEHGMLSVLRFKKSLFAGVLDGGEKEVFLGKGRLDRFMESVESVAAEIQPAPLAPEIRVDDLDDTAEESAPEPRRAPKQPRSSPSRSHGSSKAVSDSCTNSPPPFRRTRVVPMRRAAGSSRGRTPTARCSWPSPSPAVTRSRRSPKVSQAGAMTGRGEACSFRQTLQRKHLERSLSRAPGRKPPILPAKIIRNRERAWEKERDARYFTLREVEREMLFPIPFSYPFFLSLTSALALFVTMGAARSLDPAVVNPALSTFRRSCAILEPGR